MQSFKNIFEMWKMVRFLDKNYCQLNYAQLKHKASKQLFRLSKAVVEKAITKQGLNLNEDEKQKIIKDVSSDLEEYQKFILSKEIDKTDLGINKAAFISLYSENKLIGESKENQISIHRVFKLCIKNGYISSLSDNEDMVVITEKGENFSSYELLLYEFSRNVKKIWLLIGTVVTTVITTTIIYSSTNILKFLIDIIKWIRIV